MADQTFEAKGQLYSALLLLGVGAVSVLLSIAAAKDEPAALAFMVPMTALYIGGALHTLIYAPYQVTLAESGVVLQARARERVIPWRDLVAVRLRTARHSALYWEQRGRRPLRSPVFTDSARLLAEISHRSPETILS